MSMKKKTDKQNKKDNQIPGYPHYPASEDIMSKDAREREDLNVEDLTSSISENRKVKSTSSSPGTSKKSKTAPRSEADLTKDDLQALGSLNRSNDGGDDELLDDLAIGPDFSGDDLDVPGAELDDDMENLGSEDEENNYYSRGQE